MSKINRMSLKELYDLKVILNDLRNEYYVRLSIYDKEVFFDDKQLTPEIKSIVERKNNIDNLIGEIKNKIEEVVYNEFIKKD
jgi:hypothetical protein